MRKPKMRELKEAVTAVFKGPHTVRFPKESLEIPVLFRGKPEFNEDGCVGCKACFEVCPANAISVLDAPAATPPIRKLVLNYGQCIFCGECQSACITSEGIKLTHTYDLATLDPLEFQESEHVEKELVLCEVCGAAISAREHLVWIADKLGAKKFANPTLVLLSETVSPDVIPEQGQRQPGAFVDRSDNVRVLCPECRRAVVVREVLG